MNVVEVARGQSYLIEIAPVLKSDFKHLGADRYFFDWNEEASFEILKLTIQGKEIYWAWFLRKQQEFAQDLDIIPVSLSQILNNHRESKEEFFKKLMIHSERVFKTIKGFHKQSWDQVYFRDKNEHSVPCRFCYQENAGNFILCLLKSIV